jgi:hypothetical protein
VTTAAGGTNLYPSLEDVASLFRSLINDDGTGQSGPTGGQIATDQAPFMLPFMNSAMRDLYSDLRIIGDQTLMIDNYVLTGLPVINGPEGAGTASPETQVYLGYNGYFDGTVMWPNFTLPINTMMVTRIWERLTGSQGPFVPMVEAQFGLPGQYQQERNGIWEYRGDAVWMPGATVPVDLRIRGTLNFVNWISVANSLNFAITYFPVQDSTNAIVDKMLVLYSRRFAPDQTPSAMQSAAASLMKLKQEIIRRRQTVEYTRQDFAEGAGNGLAWANEL